MLCCRLWSWDGSGGAAVNPATDPVAGLPLLLARCFLFYFRCFSCLPRLAASRRTSLLPSSISEAPPAGFGLPRPQAHHHDGKGLHRFLCRREVNFRTHVSAITLIVCSQFKIVPGVAHCSVFFELLYLYQELHTGDYGGGLGKQDLLYSNILIFSYFYQQYLVLFAMAPRKNCSSVVVPAF